MRAAALSIIPNTDGAARAIGQVMPELKGKLDGMSLRVPTPTGSITDLVAMLNEEADIEAVNAAFRESSNDASYRGVLEYSDEPLVSADIVGNPASCIFSALDTMANGPHGEGARLVRQRMGLLEPPRRSRRVPRTSSPPVVDPVPQLEDLRLSRGTRVLLRADFNTPLRDGKIEDDLRITAALPTIAWLRERDCEIVCCSHPRAPEGQSDPKYSLAPVAARLGELLGIEVPLASGSGRLRRDRAVAVPRARPGHDAREPAVRGGRGSNDPAFATNLAELGDVFVNDAFGAAHRAHASIVGPPLVMPSAAGRLLAREVEVLGHVARRTEAAVRRRARGSEGQRQARRDRRVARSLRSAPDRRRDGVHLPDGAGRARRRLPRGARAGRPLPQAARDRARSRYRPTSSPRRR
jgi:hypothetical protein